MGKLHRIGLSVALLGVGSDCTPAASPVEALEVDAPAPTVVANEQVVEHCATASVWDGWLSRAGAMRQGPSAERTGDSCLLTDLQFMDAPLYRVRETVGAGAALIPALPGRVSRYDSSHGASARPGDLVLGSQVVEGHRCVYAIDDRGVLAAGFVAQEHLEPIPDPPSQPLEQLVGCWADAGWEVAGATACAPDHFSVARTAKAGFVLDGRATWCCGCDGYDTHFGAVVGEIEHCGGEGIATGDCQVAFVQRGPFLMVADDNSCGGMNVRFLGIYLKVGADPNGCPIAATPPHLGSRVQTDRG